MTLLKRLQEKSVKQFRAEFWKMSGSHPKELDNKQDNYVRQIITNTVTTVLDEVENEARDLYLESDDENYQRALTDIKAIIGNLKRTEI